MKIGSTAIKVAVVVNSLLLVGALVCYRVGWIRLPFEASKPVVMSRESDSGQSRPPANDYGNNWTSRAMSDQQNSDEDSVLSDAKEQMMMASSKSAPVVLPPRIRVCVEPHLNVDPVNEPFSIAGQPGTSIREALSTEIGVKGKVAIEPNASLNPKATALLEKK